MKKFDFKPFDKVLVRDYVDEKWMIDLFERIEYTEEGQYFCIGGIWEHCIPYNDDTKHLLGTTDDYKEPRNPVIAPINWEEAPKTDVVAQKSEPSWQPKDGDFIVRYTEIVICKEPYRGEDGSYSFLIYAAVGLDGNNLTAKCNKSYYEQWEVSPATEEEKNLLLSKLHEAGKDWDAEKKEIVDWKWKPKEGEHIYALWMSPVELRFFYEGTEFEDTKIMRKAFSRGLVCRTEEDAKNRCKELNDVLNTEK